MFKIKGDMKPITRGLTKMQSKLIPSAAAKAINKTLFQIMDAEKAQMPKKLDRPTPFTVKAFKINMAKQHQLYGDIHIKPIQWGYLQYQVEGGTSVNRVDIPTSNLKLNKYGNIPGKRTGYVKGNKFIKTIGGIKGVWKKTGGKRNSKLKLLVVLDKTVTYRKRFPFYKIAGGVARARFQRNFARTMQQAITRSM